MEYNFTKEWKQPHKMYVIGKLPITAIFPEGIKTSLFVTFIVVAIVFVGIIVLSAVKGITFLNQLFYKNWLVILFFVGVGLWTLFSLSWDKKSFFKFILGRIRYESRRNTITEHEHKACYLNEVVSFQRSNKRAWKR